MVRVMKEELELLEKMAKMGYEIRYGGGKLYIGYPCTKYVDCGEVV